MNLIETLKRYQNKILDSGILIEYSLFFDKENIWMICLNPC